MFGQDFIDLAETILSAARQKKTKIATAESCTGGLIAACLTEVPGSSDVVDRSYVTYSNEAKMDMLGVPEELIVGHGAVSEPVATAMAIGALERSQAKIAVSVTGIAGPGGGTADKPVGRVHMACARGADVFHEQHDFGDIGRDLVRQKSVHAALLLLKNNLS